MRHMIEVAHQQLQRVLSRRQLDARIRFTRAKMQVIAIGWNLLIERRQVGIDQ
jgi:hypothetical protein